jgi:hypothetical protein
MNPSDVKKVLSKSDFKSIRNESEFINASKLDKNNTHWVVFKHPVHGTFKVKEEVW